jgi:hypothetical protein
VPRIRYQEELERLQQAIRGDDEIDRRYAALQSRSPRHDGRERLSVTNRFRIGR